MSEVSTYSRIRALGTRLGKGWQLSTIYTAISGRPFVFSRTAALILQDRGYRGSIRATMMVFRLFITPRNPDAYVAIVPNQFTVPLHGNARQLTP